MVNRVEELLRQVRPREPTPHFLGAGLARIAAHDTAQERHHRGWRFAAIGLAALLSVSVILNIVLWQTKEAGGEPGESMDDPGSATAYLAYSTLRQEGGLLVRETHHTYIAAEDSKND